MPSGLFSLRLMFERSKSESLRDVSVTRIGDTFPTVFRRLHLLKTSKTPPPRDLVIFYLFIETRFLHLITLLFNFSKLF